MAQQNSISKLLQLALQDASGGQDLNRWTKTRCTQFGTHPMIETIQSGVWIYDNSESVFLETHRFTIHWLKRFETSKFSAKVTSIDIYLPDDTPSFGHHLFLLVRARDPSALSAEARPATIHLMRSRVSPSRTPASVSDWKAVKTDTITWEGWRILNHNMTHMTLEDRKPGYGWKIPKKKQAQRRIKPFHLGGSPSASGPVPGVCMVRKVKCRTSMGKSQGPIGIPARK